MEAIRCRCHLQHRLLLLEKRSGIGNRSIRGRESQMVCKRLARCASSFRHRHGWKWVSCRRKTPGWLYCTVHFTCHPISFTYYLFVSASNCKLIDGGFSVEVHIPPVNYITLCFLRINKVLVFGVLPHVDKQSRSLLSRQALLIPTNQLKVMSALPDSLEKESAFTYLHHQAFH